MTWEAQAAAALAAGPTQTCAAGHRTHQTQHVTINTGDHTIPDWPTVRPDLAHTISLEIFDTVPYRDTRGYCPGDDEVSRSIAANGGWEGFETALVSQLLADDDNGWVVDIGCHVGWYSTLAAVYGRQALAVDADLEVLTLAAVNSAANGDDDWLIPARGFIGPDTGTVPPGSPIRLLKADVEGAEHHAVRAFTPSLQAGDVDFLMLEMTDAFGGEWRTVVETLTGCGYKAFRIPDKQDRVDLGDYTADPLATIRRHPLRDLTGSRQINALFIRGDL